MNSMNEESIDNDELRGKTDLSFDKITHLLLVICIKEKFYLCGDVRC